MLSSADIPRFALGELLLSSFLAYWPRIAHELRNFDVVNVHGPASTMSDAFQRLSTAAEEAISLLGRGEQITLPVPRPTVSVWPPRCRGGSGRERFPMSEVCGV